MNPSIERAQPATRKNRLILVIVGVVAALALIGAIYFGVSQTIKQSKIQAAQQAPVVTGVTAVTMTNYSFSPSNIQVAKGATVTWTNQDSAPHNVVFDNHMAQSDILPEHGGTYSYTFTAPGAYSYHCGIHPEMVGKVIVTG